MVWPNKRLQELAKHFVPAADEAYNLLTGKGFESDLFRTIWNVSHFAGDKGQNSQGVYALTPSGILLGSTWALRPEPVIEVLERALHSWKQLRPEQRLRSKLPSAQALERPRWEKLYPEGGLVLQTFYRDLPRSAEESPGTYAEPQHRTAWNQDFTWFRKEETRQLLPPRLVKGAEHAVPDALIRRLARYHLLDHVRSISVPFQEHEVETAHLTARILSHDGDLVVARFEGTTRTSAEGEWSTSWLEETSGKTSPQRRGYEAQLLGWGTYSVSQGRFVAFDLVAAGTRWGGTLACTRAGDQRPNPMGVLFTLAEDKPAHCVAPFYAPVYQFEFWR